MSGMVLKMSRAAITRADVSCDVSGERERKREKEFGADVRPDFFCDGMLAKWRREKK